jgi:hypothetical protein
MTWAAVFRGARKTTEGWDFGRGLRLPDPRQVDAIDRLILILPNLLNCVVAIYLILIGLIGLNDIYHFMS